VSHFLRHANGGKQGVVQTKTDPLEFKLSLKFHAFTDLN